MATEHQQPLHRRDPTGRFSDRGEDYRRYRPSYPAAALDAVLQGLGEPARVRAADVGAGTGISTVLLAARGVRVVGVEPNGAMRAQADAHPLVEWVEGTAERTTLPGGAMDLVLCAQSFHWFDADAALREFARVLRPGGRVALVWNDRDESDGFTRAYGDLLRTACEHDPVVESHTKPGPLFASALFRDARSVEFANEQTLDGPGLIGRAMSASYIPKEGPRHTALIAGLRELFAAAAGDRGRVTLRYLTRVYLAERGAAGERRGA